MLLWIIRTLSIFLLLRCWLRDKYSSSSISLSLILLSGSILVVLALNQMLLLDSRMSTLKGRILAMSQSTFTTSNQFLLKNNLQPLYKLLSSSFLLFIQLQLLILTLCTETFFQPFFSNLTTMKHISIDSQ